MKTNPGRFFEDYAVGDTYQHPFGRTISEADSTWFTLLTCNTNQNHFNAHLAQSNPITQGRIIVNSGFTVALVLGLSVIDMSQNAVANLGWTDIKLTHPVYIGDTIYADLAKTFAEDRLVPVMIGSAEQDAGGGERALLTVCESFSLRGQLSVGPGVQALSGIKRHFMVVTDELNGKVWIPVYILWSPSRDFIS